MRGLAQPLRPPPHVDRVHLPHQPLAGLRLAAQDPLQEPALRPSRPHAEQGVPKLPLVRGAMRRGRLLSGQSGTASVEERDAEPVSGLVVRRRLLRSSLVSTREGAHRGHDVRCGARHAEPAGRGEHQAHDHRGDREAPGQRSTPALKRRLSWLTERDRVLQRSVEGKARTRSSATRRRRLTASPTRARHSPGRTPPLALFLGRHPNETRKSRSDSAVKFGVLSRSRRAHESLSVAAGTTACRTSVLLRNGALWWLRIRGGRQLLPYAVG